MVLPDRGRFGGRGGAEEAEVGGRLGGRGGAAAEAARGTGGGGGSDMRVWASPSVERSSILLYFCHFAFETRQREVWVKWKRSHAASFVS